MNALRTVAPTGRAAVILAVIAVCALLVGPAIAAAAAAALVVAAAVDAWAVRRAPGLQRTVAPVMARGVGTPLQVRAIAGDGRRVLLRQPATAQLRLSAGTGAGALDAVLTPLRRGRHPLPAVSAASCGPLGLARVHHPAGEPTSVAVYPDLVAAQPLIARLRRQLAMYPGLATRGPLGLGTDFESVREYAVGDDVRQLNWQATARLGRPMSNQYRVDRDRDLVCLLDAGRLMTAALGDRTMLDAALDAVTVLALAADELGDRCGAVAFDAEVRRAVTPGRRGGRAVIEALFDLEARAVDSDYELAFTRVGRTRRAFVAVFTDLVDEAAARALVQSMPMLARRHAVVVVSATDPALEHALSTPPAGLAEVAAALVADDVVTARSAAVGRLRRAGAGVIEAPAGLLGQRCLDAYLQSKSRVRF